MSITAGDTDVNSLKIPDMRSLISRAFGLIVIDGKMNHVRLAHETAADYIRHRAVDMPNGDRLLADACMAYLQLNPVCDPESEYDHLEQTKKAYPFLRYATSFWASHIRLDQDRFLDCVLCLLRNDSAVKTMTRLMWQYDADWDCAHNVRGLHLAAYFGLTSAVSKLVRSSKDVDVLDGQATTPLMYAAMKGEKDTIAVLLEAGADPSRTCDRGRTALHRACQYTRVEVVQLLLQCSKDVALSAIDEQFGKKKALAWAIHTGSDAILQFLLRNGYVEDTLIWQDRDSNNPLILAAATGRAEIIETLLADGRVPIDTTDDKGDTALTAAARQGHVPVVDLLLQNGADLEARNDEGATVLLSSIPAAPDEVTRLLIERGADVNAFNNEQRGTLFFCAVCNRPNLMRFFLELGQELDVNVQGVRRATPLYVAVEHDYVECVEVLLEHGARTDVRARNGLTPVSLAREGFHQDTLPLLETARSRERQEDIALTARVIRTRTDLWDDEVSLHAAVVQMDVSQLTAYLDERSQQGFDIDALDCICLQTALHITARRDLGPKARLLLDRGAKTDIFDQFGFQALHGAVFHDSLAVTEELIQRGADINSSKPGDPYVPPLHIAIDRQNPAIAFCLVNNGAIIDPNDETTTWLVGAAAQLGEFEVVRKALDAGVPFNERGEDGQTLYQRAKKHGHVQVAKYLFEQAQKDDREKKVSRGGTTTSSLTISEVNSNKKQDSEMLIAEEGDTQAGAEDPSGRQTAGSCPEKEGALAQVAGVLKCERPRLKWRRWILVTIAIVLAIAVWAYL